MGDELNSAVQRAALLKSSLLKIEEELKSHFHWSKKTPTHEQLASTEPFCLDTLSFPEWLQFVFLPRMRHLLEAGLDLPENCQIAPMAEQHFIQNSAEKQNLIALIKEFDTLFLN